ncbi:MAG: hypothetical protein WA949_21595 [Phormidesmis sp.]
MRSFYRLAIGVCVGLVVVVSLWLSPAKASSALNESRIRQLEFQVRSLQTQISQIQSRSPGSPSSSPSSPASPPVAPGAADILNDPTSQEQFDNLATLVIEINQRVKALENRLSN